MIDKSTRLRWRRKYKRSRQHVEGLGDTAEEHIDKHFFRRLTRFAGVRRFVSSWLLLIVLLAGITIAQTRALGKYYLDTKPVAGGAHTEGMVGAFTNANPLYAVGAVDTTVSRLVFSGLLKLGPDGELESDLAQTWTVNEAGDTYVVRLKPNIKWHDGTPLRVEDVLFTFETAAHPDAKSPLFQTWREVIVTATDDRTIEFKLKNPLATFAYSLTTGILPAHLLEKFGPEQLRSASFNTLSPVGTGPFKWQAIETLGGREDLRQQVGLTRFDNYVNGRPELEQFVLHAYTNQEQLIEAFTRQQISAMVGLDSVPDEVADDSSLHTYSNPLSAATTVFLRNDVPQLKLPAVRQALLQAVNVPELIKQLGYPVVAVDNALLKEHFAYSPRYKQHGHNIDKANQLLDKAGWRRGADGIRQNKKGEPLTLRLYAQSTADFTKVSQVIQDAWKEIGVQAEVILQSAEDLQNTIANRSYDVIMSGITIGPDPDVFPYWHSSQFDPRSNSRLNFAHYNSGQADVGLETARTRVDPELRKVKLEPFQVAWQKDVPGFSLYQPRMLYITHGEVFEYGAKRMTDPADRLWNVHEWMIRRGQVLKE